MLDKISLGHTYSVFHHDYFKDSLGHESGENYENYCTRQCEAFEEFLSSLGVLSKDCLIFSHTPEKGWRGVLVHNAEDVRWMTLELFSILEDTIMEITWIGGTHYMKVSIGANDGYYMEEHYIVPCAWVRYAMAENEQLESAFEEDLLKDHRVRAAIAWAEGGKEDGSV